MSTKTHGEQSSPASHQGSNQRAERPRWPASRRVKSARGILFFWGLVIISLVLYGSLYRERTIVTAIKQNALATQEVIKGYENTLLRQQQRIERMDSVMLQTQQRLLQVYEEKTLLQQENKRIDSARNQLDSAHQQIKKKVKTYEREITRLRNSYELPRVGEN